MGPSHGNVVTFLSALNDVDVDSVTSELFFSKPFIIFELLISLSDGFMSSAASASASIRLSMTASNPPVMSSTYFLWELMTLFVFEVDPALSFAPKNDGSF